MLVSSRACSKGGIRMTFTESDLNRLEMEFRKHLLGNIRNTYDLLNRFFYQEQRTAGQPEMVAVGWGPVEEAAVRKAVGLWCLPCFGPLDNFKIIEDGSGNGQIVRQWPDFGEWETTEDKGEFAENLLKGVLSGNLPTSTPFEAVCLIAVGLRFYVKQIVASKTELIKAISEILAVDRCMMSALAWLSSYPDAASKQRAELHRKRKIQDTFAERSEKQWSGILEVISEGKIYSPGDTLHHVAKEIIKGIKNQKNLPDEMTVKRYLKKFAGIEAKNIDQISRLFNTDDKC